MGEEGVGKGLIEGYQEKREETDFSIVGSVNSNFWSRKFKKFGDQ